MYRVGIWDTLQYNYYIITKFIKCVFEILDTDIGNISTIWFLD